MEIIRQWAFGICCSAVAAGIIQTLLPQSSLGKTGRVVASAFFVCSLVFPLLEALPALAVELEPFPQEESCELSRELEILLDERVRGQVQEALGGLAREKLEEMGISPGDVRIDITTQPGVPLEADGLAAQILLPEEYRFRHTELVKSLEYQLGIAVQLEYED